MTIEKLDSLEDRIQKPAYLLLVVVVLLFLIVGLVDLIDSTSRNPVIFGQYSVKYFAMLTAYTLATLAWGSLLLRPNDDRWLVTGLDFIQSRAAIALALLVGIVLVFAALLLPQSRLHQVLLEYAAVQVTIIVILILAAGLILFYNWGDVSQPQWWRKLVAGFLGVLVAVELIMQLLAMVGLLPSLTTTMDGFAPYSRVYQADEGHGNGMTNQLGRYAPTAKLQPGSYRVALVGDTFIQALQVRKDEQLGVQLEEKLSANKTDAQTREVLSVGYPDYGPGMYLSNWMVAVLAREFAPDEAIIFFDLGSDFQEVDGPGYGLPYMEYRGQGRAQLNLDNFFTDLHNAEHEVYYGHEGFQLVRVLGSNYLTPRVIGRFLANPQTAAAQMPAMPASGDIDRADAFLFNENSNEEAVRIASAQINMANEQLRRSAIGTKLVTIPAFSEAFYSQDTWNTQFGDSDLLLPEQQLREIAGHYGMPFLGLGSYMAAQGLNPEDVKRLYYQEGLGHFTPEGHALAAEAVYECFFAKTVSSAEGCDLNQ